MGQKNVNFNNGSEYRIELPSTGSSSICLIALNSIIGNPEKTMGYIRSDNFIETEIFQFSFEDIKAIKFVMENYKKYMKCLE